MKKGKVCGIISDFLAFVSAVFLTGTIVMSLVVLIADPTGIMYETKTLRDLKDHTEWAEYDEEFTAEKDRAIVIIHGLMDGALYNPSDEEGKNRSGLWNGGLSMLNFKQLLTSDEECEPTVKVRVGNMKDDAPYSANAMTKDVYDYFNEKYSDNYDVVCWQYDWRQHLDGAAVQLDRFLTACGYKQAILVGHSMGTCVVSRYLTMGEAQREKIAMFIPFGGPMLGSIDADDFMFDKVGGLKGSMISMISDMAKALKMDMTEAARNFATCYHLMISQQLSDTPLYAEGETAFKVDGKYIDAKAFHDLMRSYDWARTSRGNIKMILKTLDEFQNENFIDGKHVSHYVPTEYVVGMGVDTTLGFELDSEKQIITARRLEKMGDGLVPAYSASAGLPLDSDNVHIMNGCNHMEIMLAANGVRNVLDDIMRRFENGLAGKTGNN